MDNLEKQLQKMPKPKMSRWVDIKIRLKIYKVILSRGLSGFFKSFFSWHLSLTRVAYLSLVLVLVLGSGVVYAATNDSIIPGNVFYPLKKTIEKVETQLAVTDDAKVDTMNKFSERRVKEALNLVQENLKIEATSTISDDRRQDIKDTINEAVDNMGSALEVTKKIEDEGDAKKAKEKIQKQNEVVQKYLEDIEDIAKDSYDKQVSEEIDKARKTLKEYSRELEDEVSERSNRYYKNSNSNTEDYNIDEDKNSEKKYDSGSRDDDKEKKDNNEDNNERDR